MTKKIPLTIAIILVIIAAFTFYVNRVLLPVQVRAFIINAAEEHLGRTCSFGRLYFNPLKGIVLTDIRVESKVQGRGPILTISEASARPLLMPLLKKKLILASVRIETPAIDLVQFEPGRWNISDILKPRNDPQKGGETPDVVISDILISKGTLTLTDNSGPEIFAETIGPIDIKGSISLKSSIHILADIGLPATQGSLHLDGNYALSDGTVSLHTNVNDLTLERYLRFAPHVKIPIEQLTLKRTVLDITWKEGTLSVSGEGDIPQTSLIRSDGPTINGAITFNNTTFTIDPNGKMSAKGDVKTKGLLITLPDGPSVAGDIHLAIKDFNAQNNALTFSGGMDAINSRIALSPTLIIQGNLHSKSIQLDLDNGTPKGKLDLNGENIMIQLGEGRSFAGGINIPVVTITRNLTNLTVSGNGQLLDMLLEVEPGKTVAGTASLDNMIVLLQKRSVNATTDLTFKDLSLKLPDISLSAQLKAPKTTLTVNNGKIALASRLTCTDLALYAPDGIVFKGSPTLDLEVSADPALTPPLTYQGSASFINASVNGVPKVKDLTNISGQLTFSPKSLDIAQLTFKALQTPVTMKGKIVSFDDPRIDLNATINALDLALIETLAPEILAQNGLTLSGTTSLMVEAKGNLKAMQEDPLAANITADLILNAVSIAKENGPEIKNIVGDLSYEPSSLSWKELKAEILTKSYTFEGYLQNPKAPLIVSNIKSDDLRADVQIKKVGDEIRIDRLSGSFLESSYDVTGTLTTKPNNPPVIDLRGEIKASLRDMVKALPPGKADLAKDLDLAGIIKASFKTKGILTDPFSLDSSLSIETPAAYFQGYQVKDLIIDITHKNGQLSPIRILGDIYGGDAEINATVDLRDISLPFSLSLDAEDIDLEQLKKATPLKQKQLSGKLSLSGETKGRITDYKNMEGLFLVHLREGYLWELDILSKVLTILSSKFHGGNIVVREGDASIRITNGHFSTDDLTLRSDKVTLLGKGWIDWDQNINFELAPHTDPTTSADGTIDLRSLIDPTAELLTIRVNGTLKEPKFEHDLTAPKAIKKTIENTVGNILQLFE